MTHYEEALEFRTVMEQPIGALNRRILSLQAVLVYEEAREVDQATNDLYKDLDNKRARENLLKELADTCYVCYQFAAAAGWNLDVALTRVHESNMSKLVDGKPQRRADGKVLKGPNYKPPTLIDLV